jgi:hypothetical protein
MTAAAKAPTAAVVADLPPYPPPNPLVRWEPLTRTWRAWISLALPTNVKPHMHCIGLFARADLAVATQEEALSE